MLIARVILDLHKNPEYLGFLRMVVADSRQFPWIAEEFAAVMDPQTERLIRYLAHLNAMGILDCRNPTLAAHQFMGMLNEFSLWPWMMGRESIPVSRRGRGRRDDPDVPVALPADPSKEARSRRRGVTSELLFVGRLLANVTHDTSVLCEMPGRRASGRSWVCFREAP